MNNTSSLTRGTVTARALLLGERIDTVGLERNDVLSTMPMAFRAGGSGCVALFLVCAPLHILTNLVARRSPSGVSAGSRPSAGSTIRDVRRLSRCWVPPSHQS